MTAPLPLELVVALLLAVLLLMPPGRLAFAAATVGPLRRFRARVRHGFDVVCMETAALAAIAVSAVAAAGTAVYSGQQQASAAKANAQAQAAQYAEEQRAARLAAEQEQAAKRRELAAALSAQDALRAARGLDLGSGTGEAIRRDSIEQAENDITTIQANANSRDRRLGLASDSALVRGRNEARTAVVSSYGSAVGSLAGGVSAAYNVMKRSGS